MVGDACHEAPDVEPRHDERGIDRRVDGLVDSHLFRVDPAVRFDEEHQAHASCVRDNEVHQRENAEGDGERGREPYQEDRVLSCRVPCDIRPAQRARAVRSRPVADAAPVEGVVAPGCLPIGRDRVQADRARGHRRDWVVRVRLIYIKLMAWCFLQQLVSTITAKNARAHPESNWRPIDLQSIALPLSYTPVDLHFLNCLKYSYCLCM
jgi:hypothetical protein